MTGLKSGSGDDLWGDDSEEPAETDENDVGNSSESKSATNTNQSAASGENAQTEQTSPPSTADTRAAEDSTATQSTSDASSNQQPYIVRRAVQNKSVQFERNERLTFFVHDDVVQGERDLITNIESELGRSVPKFDVREAVYRAALRNRDEVLDELLKMGYSTGDL